MHQNLDHKSFLKQHPQYQACKRITKQILVGQYIDHCQKYPSLGHLPLINIDSIVDIKMSDNTLKDVKDSSGKTILHHAIIYKNKDLVEYLIYQQGMSMKEVDNAGLGVLHLAVLSQCKEITLLLLQLGAQASLRDIYGNTPRNYVNRDKHFDICFSLRSSEEHESNNILEARQYSFA